MILTIFLDKPCITFCQNTTGRVGIVFKADTHISVEQDTHAEDYELVSTDTIASHLVSKGRPSLTQSGSPSNRSHRIDYRP